MDYFEEHYFSFSFFTLHHSSLVVGREVEEPDIHLILEYSSGASWGPYTSRRANRFVFIVIKMHLEKDRGTLQIKFLNGVYAHLRLCTNLSFFCFFLLVLCRYIIHSDDHNPYLDSMEDFSKKLNNFRPDLIVVGGLQMMDNFPFQSGKQKKIFQLLALLPVVFTTLLPACFLIWFLRVIVEHHNLLNP